jgi:hypothetical protein
VPGSKSFKTVLSRQEFYSSPTSFLAFFMRSFAV